MREILFRGKRIGDGKWFEGYYCGGTEDKTISPCIFEYLGGMKGYDYHNIILDTLGQYTGLTDKNGKKIFEGDIIKLTINRSLIFSVNWVDDCGMFCLKCLSHHPRLNLEAFDTDFTTVDGDECEIIGNVFDNSDLLKGE